MMKRLLLLLLFPISLFAQSNKLSKADKIYGLSKFWQEVNYNFVYLNKVDRPKWDSTYKALIISIPETKNDYQYYRELQKFCALLKDGHTNIYMPETKDFETMTTMFGDYRFFIQNIGGKAIIARVNLSKKDEIPPGSEVIEVNGQNTNDYIAAHVAPYISSSTDYVLKDLSISSLLKGLAGDEFTIKIRKPKGQMVSLKLTHKTTTEKEVYPAFDDENQLLDFKWYTNDIAYIALNSFGDRKIDTLFHQKLPELQKAKKIIIDLRKNGGGNTDIGTEILQHLTNDTVLYGAKNATRQHLPAFKAWGKYVEPKDTIKNEWNKKALLINRDNYYYTFDYRPKKIRLDMQRVVVPTAILIGHNTASAAEDFLIYADNQRHMVKIGQNSYGSTGQPFVFDLPGGGSARVCTKKDTYPDGREFVGYGIKPDMEIVPSLEDYIQKKDPVLEKALNYLNKIK
ncbi:S41 family peptidase [Pedobacter nutrimenti]|uniref:C-terminal processing protease CtpA/Prc n=1 Tax=Pedobacter nutrimenti TaxID=1241337 RepID=A0A318USB6_9SPHI|nr:S41 family peptidase [Pedobacter nutrimenti]PYF74469.1 C-terminal processing protease CtpA/Prc [Pedobacter nutrimenti]